jgi:hypothetical protein
MPHGKAQVNENIYQGKGNSQPFRHFVCRHSKYAKPIHKIRDLMFAASDGKVIVFSKEVVLLLTVNGFHNFNSQDRRRFETKLEIPTSPSEHRPNTEAF